MKNTRSVLVMIVVALLLGAMGCAEKEPAYEREPGPFDDRRGGLGLALPLARRVIERHGGRLWAPADEALGRGSAIVSLPLSRS